MVGEIKDGKFTAASATIKGIDPKDLGKEMPFDVKQIKPIDVSGR